MIRAPRARYECGVVRVCCGEGRLTACWKPSASSRTQQIYSSAALLEELADVLTRKPATKRLVLIDKSVRDILADYVEAVELVEPIEVPRKAPTTPMTIMCPLPRLPPMPIASFPGIRDLLSLESHQGIPILTAAQAVAMVEAS